MFSNSLQSADWGEATIVAGDLAEAVARLEQERADGYLLARGGARFARSLVETGLIDEYRLLVHPAVLGAGERIFRAPLAIEPISTAVFSGAAVAYVFAAHRESSSAAPISPPGGSSTVNPLAFPQSFVRGPSEPPRVRSALAPPAYCFLVAGRTRGGMFFHNKR